MSQSPEAVKVWWEARRAWHSRPLTPHENGSVSLGHSEAAASVIEAALQKARDEEALKIANWLRARTKGARGHAEDTAGEIVKLCAQAIQDAKYREHS